jgi:aspartate/methionine/tyrosine aminotransferase
MVRGLRAIPGVICAMPEGACFVLPNLQHYIMPVERLSEYLLDHARVATMPGTWFGSGGRGHLRLVFKSGIPEIERGIGRIASALAELDVLGST